MRYLLLISLWIYSFCAITQDSLEVVRYRQLLHELKLYADSIAIDTALYTTTLPDSAIALQIDSLLTEIHYGKKPSYISYEAISPTLDSNKIYKWRHTYKWTKPVITTKEKSLILLYQSHSHIDTLKRIAQTLNFERWRKRFSKGQYLVVNIPAAELSVYDSLQRILLLMNVVVGKPATPTPCMVTIAREIVTYPYWNVPKSIATKEMLPKIKKDLSYIDENRLQVFDGKGKLIDFYSIDWSTVSATNFNYRFRQAAGCDNALGVIKFNLANPFDIYMHDTNQRLLLTRQKRWLSHGCIRLQKPIELANLLANTPKYDKDFLEECLIDQTPKTDKLPTTLPIFVVYNMVDIDHKGKVRYFADVYNYYQPKPVVKKP